MLRSAITILLATLLGLAPLSSVRGKTSCGAGTYLQSPFNTCIDCPAGTSSAAGATSASQCTACASGTYSLSGGVCTTCPTGFTSLAGAAVCTIDCPAGQGLASLFGVPYCAQCGTGTYSNNGLCTTCPSGQTASAGASACTATPTGHLRKARSQRPFSCARLGYMRCPITAGRAGFECIDVHNTLDSCGGCIGVDSGPIGRDCSEIEHTDEVRCLQGHCVVKSCRKGYVVGEAGDSCVKL